MIWITRETLVWFGSLGRCSVLVASLGRRNQTLNWLSITYFGFHFPFDIFNSTFRCLIYSFLFVFPTPLISNSGIICLSSCSQSRNNKRLQFWAHNISMIFKLGSLKWKFKIKIFHIHIYILCEYSCVFVLFLCVWYIAFVVVWYENKKCKSLKEKQAKLFGKYNLSETQLGTLAVWQTYGNQDNCRLHQY